MKKHISPKWQFIKARWVIFEENQYMSKHTFHIINPSTYLFQFQFQLLDLLIF